MRLTVNETQLYFDVEGLALVPHGISMRERPTIVFLHGGPGFDHTLFKPFVSELTEVAQLVYLDLRGQGRSGRPPIDTCSPRQMADDVAEFCRTLEINRPYVFGHSFGGFVALDLAIRHPSIAGGLILLNTAASSAEMAGGLSLLEERNGPEARAAAERLFGGDLSQDAMSEFQRLAFPAYIGDQSFAGAVGESFARSSFNFEVASRYFNEFAGTYDVRPGLGTIGVPSMVITGELDWVVHADASRALAAGIRGAELRVIPGASHLTYIESADVVLDAIRRFVSAGELATVLAAASAVTA